MSLKKRADDAVKSIREQTEKVMGKAADHVAHLAVLSPEQSKKVCDIRLKYLQGNDERSQTKAQTVALCLQAINTEITQSYLTRLSSFYRPVKGAFSGFNPYNRIQFFDITKWVVDAKENNLDKLTNVYQVLSGENCTVALIYTRHQDSCTVTMAVSNCGNSAQSPIVQGFAERIRQAFRGNFPGVELDNATSGIPPVLGTPDSNPDFVVAAVSTLPSERSDHFISQSIEKLLDGIVPSDEDYSVVLLAQPSGDLEARRSRLYDLYSNLSPYATWQKTRGSNESLSQSAAAILGVGLSANIDTGFSAGFVSKLSLTGSANFSRVSGEAHTGSLSEGETESFTNYNVKHMLDQLEVQVKRLEQSTALGMWDFAAYVLSGDYNTAVNVAHMYLSLTQGNDSYLEQSAVNVWTNDDQVQAIVGWLQALQHPVFSLSEDLDANLAMFPTPVTAAIPVSGEELAHALNFPQTSVPGLPVYECVPFGREVIPKAASDSVLLGKIYHMRQVEKASVSLDPKELASHVFVTGSTGSGKSNAIYTLLHGLCLQSEDPGSPGFLVIEPAKGEYKEVLGGYPQVQVYGTNPRKTSLLKINPFSFPEDIHVLEHIDRLIEIFNACWPMYAAMPAVLKAAVEQAYLNCGWSLSSSTCCNTQPTFPTFYDVMRALPDIVDEKGFSRDTQGDYKGALLTRLESLTNGINGEVFCAHDEISNKDLFDGRVIVDFSRVGSSETKALLMGILILKLQEYRMAQRSGGKSRTNNDLQHITVLEEAHNLLRRTTTLQTQESSNLQGKSVEMLTNAIAEMRTYGEGFIISDQAPGLLDMAAIRNTNTKLIFRLPDEEDRALVGKAAALTEDQITELSRLETGVAAVYQSHWLEPVLCKVDYFDPEKQKKFPYTVPGFSTDSLTEEICRSLLPDTAGGVGAERENVDQIKLWINRQKVGSSVRQLLCRYLLDKKPLLPEEKRYILYCLIKGKRILQYCHTASVEPSKQNALIDQQIRDILPISETVAQGIRQQILLHAISSTSMDSVALKDLIAGEDVQ